MSGGDVSLAESAKFRNFTRRERRALLELLENCDNSTENMLRWKGRWIRLGERPHHGEYRDHLLMKRDCGSHLDLECLAPALAVYSSVFVPHP